MLAGAALATQEARRTSDAGPSSDDGELHLPGAISPSSGNSFSRPALPIASSASQSHLGPAPHGERRLSFMESNLGPAHHGERRLSFMERERASPAAAVTMFSPASTSNSLAGSFSSSRDAGPISAAASAAAAAVGGGSGGESFSRQRSGLPLVPQQLTDRSASTRPAEPPPPQQQQHASSSAAAAAAADKRDGGVSLDGTKSSPSSSSRLKQVQGPLPATSPVATTPAASDNGDDFDEGDVLFASEQAGPSPEPGGSPEQGGTPSKAERRQEEEAPTPEGGLAIPQGPNHGHARGEMWAEGEEGVDVASLRAMGTSASALPSSLRPDLRQRLNLNCRPNDASTLSFSLSFVNHSGMRRKVGFLYDLDEDEVRGGAGRPTVRGRI